MGDNETVSESSVRMSSSESGDQLLSGVAIAITIVAITLTITSAILNYNDSPFETVVSIITFGFAVASIVMSTIFFLGYIVEADGLTESFAVGFRIGMFISMFVCSLIGFLSISYFPLKIIFTILDIVLATALLSEDFNNLKDFKNASKQPEISIAIITFAVGIFLSFFMEEDERLEMCLFFTLITGSIALLLYMTETTG